MRARRPEKPARALAARDDPLLPEAELRALFAAVVRERGSLTGEHCTSRECEILYYRCVRGYSNKEIAGELIISIRTIETHLEHASLRLRYEAVAVMRDELFRAFARAEAKAELARPA